MKVKKTLLKALLIMSITLVFSCGSEVAEARAETYCECLRKAKGELTQIDDCMAIIDSAKIEFEKTPRHWVKFQEALDECQN